MWWTLATRGVPFDALWQPPILLEAVLFEALYLIFLVGPGRRLFKNSQPVPLLKVLTFTLSMGCLFFAFGSPVDFLSDNYLFSVHMLQHVLETLFMTPLLMVGLPDWVWRGILRFRPLSALYRYRAAPILLAALFSAAYAVFHVPSVYDLTLVSENFHLFEHAIFFITALLLWWPLLDLIPEFPRDTAGWRLLNIFFAFNFGMPLNVFLIVTTNPWFPYYVHADKLIGISALGDQQLGGLVMMAGAVLAYGIAAVANGRGTDFSSAWYD